MKRSIIIFLILAFIIIEVVTGSWLSWESYKGALYWLGRAQLERGQSNTARDYFQQISTRQGAEHLGEGNHGRLARFREALPKIHYTDLSILVQETYYREGMAALAQNDWAHARTAFTSIPGYRDAQAVLKASYYRIIEPSDKVIWIVQAGVDSIISVAFSPDGLMLASASLDGQVKLVRTDDGTLIRVLKRTRDSPTKVEFSPNGQLLAIGDGGGAVQLVRVNDGALVQRIDAGVYDFAIHPNGQLLITSEAGGEGNIKIWRLSDGVLVGQVKASEYADIDFSPDGTTFAGITPSGRLTVWRLSDQTEVYRVQEISEGRRLLSISPDNHILTEMRYDTLDITIRSYRDGLTKQIIPSSETDNHTSYYTPSVVFSPDSQVLAVVSADNSIKIWHHEDARLLQTLPGDMEKIHSIAYHPNQQMIAAGSGDGTIIMWQVK